jgi:hypothetical protein
VASGSLPRLPPSGSQLAELVDVKRRDYEELDLIAAQVMEASRDDRDTDVSNLVAPHRHIGQADGHSRLPVLSILGSGLNGGPRDLVEVQTLGRLA